MPVKSPCLILLVGDEGVLCAPFDMPGAPAPFFASMTDKASGAAILTLAAKHPRMPVTLLADTLAQDLRRDTLPMRLNPFDRVRLIRRRLQQAFPQARLCASLNVKSDRAQVLLAGLQSDGPALIWLDRLAVARPVNPPRLSLLPVECAALVAKLLPQAAEDWGLLLSRQRTGGFRQIVTHKGELVFTRLTPPLPPDAEASEVAAAVAREMRASRGYLSRLGLDDRAPLRAVLLMPEAMHEKLRKADLPAHEPLLLSPHEAAWMLGLPTAPPPDDPYGDWIFASWFARKKKPCLTLMPSDLRRTQRTARIAYWGLRTAAALLLLAPGITAADAGDLATTLLTRQKESLQLAMLEKEFARERAAAEPATEPLGRLRQALERQRFYATPMPTPRKALIALNEGLGAQARLMKLDWRNDNGKPEDENLSVDARLVDAPDASDRETTVTRFRHVAQNLARAMPDYTVTVSRYPFPALPQEALSNNAPDDKAPATEPTAEFSIRRARP